MTDEEKKDFDLMEYIHTEKEKFKKEMGYTEEIMNPIQHREFIDYLKRKMD